MSSEIITKIKILELLARTQIDMYDWGEEPLASRPSISLQRAKVRLKEVAKLIKELEKP